jgi:hypothetical protein
VLEKAGLLQRRREGRNDVLTLEPEPMKQADAWIATYRRFCESTFAALADCLERGVTNSDRTLAKKGSRNRRK